MLIYSYTHHFPINYYSKEEAMHVGSGGVGRGKKERTKDSEKGRRKERKNKLR